ncbi:MAG: tetratricopeptide repeat protein [Candidatus Omnitrophota bacterium]
MTLSLSKPSRPLIALFLLGLCLTLYAGSMKAGFVIDAHYAVERNPVIKQPALYYKIFTEDFFSATDDPFLQKMYYYRPVPLVTLAIDYRLWKLKPFGYHFSNCLLHAINAFLIFCLITALFKNDALAFLTSVFFCILPTQEWVVNYIPGRMDLVQALFILLSSLALVRALESRAKGYFLLSIFYFVIALLSREVTVIYPALAFLICYFIQKNGRKSLLGALPFLAISLLYLSIRFLFYPITSSEESLGVLRTFLSLDGLGHWIFIFAAYISRFIFPWSVQSIVFSGFRFSLIKLLVFGFLITGSLLASIDIFRKHQKTFFVFGWAWILISFLPFSLMVSQFLLIGPVLSEHYLYLASIGFCLLLSGFILQARPKIQSGITALVIIYFCGLVVYNNTYWKDEKTLLNRVKYLEGEDQYVSSSQLLVLNEDPAAVLNRLQDVEDPLKKKRWILTLADHYLKQKEYSKAIEYYEQSLKGNLQSAKVYRGLGEAYAKTNQRALAIESLKKSLKLNPADDYTSYYLGFLFYQQDDFPQAIRYLEQSSFYNPDSAETLFTLGLAYFFNQQKELSVRTMKKVVDLANDKGAVYQAVAQEMYKRGYQNDAAFFLENAMKIFPQDPRILFMLGQIYYGLGEKNMALAVWQEAFNIEPKDQKTKDYILKIRDRIKAVSAQP